MSFLKHLRTTARTQIGLSLMTASALVYLFARSLSQRHTWVETWQWMDPFLAVSAVMFAIFIWFNEKKQDWENALPKRLNVFFYLQTNKGAELVSRVENAPLGGAGDIRAWGQQIGKQMNSNSNLAFNGFKVSVPIRATDNKGSDVMIYELSIWLQEHDKNMSKLWKYDDDGKLIIPNK